MISASPSCLLFRNVAKLENAAVLFKYPLNPSELTHNRVLYVPAGDKEA